MAIVTEATGASLVLATVTVKSWVAVAPAVSVAVTRMVSAPTSSFRGVPEKVCVPGSKLSHAGSGLPSASVADRVSVSPTSTSVKLVGGNSETEACVFIGGLVGNVDRGNGAIIGIVDGNGEVLRGGSTGGVGCGDANGQRPNIIIQWCAGECLRSRIEAEPGRQRAAVGKSG